MAAQKPPDIMDVNVTKFPGQQGPGPAREPGRRRLIEQLQNPFVGRLGIDRLLAWARFVFQAFQAKLGKGMSPKADNPRLDPTSLAIDRVLRPAAAKRTIRARFKSRWVGSPGSGNGLQAPCDLSSKGGTSLASGIIPRLTHNSRSRESGCWDLNYFATILGHLLLNLDSEPCGRLAIFHGLTYIARYSKDGAAMISARLPRVVTPCSPPSRHGLSAPEPTAWSRRRAVLDRVCALRQPEWAGREAETA